MDNICPLCNCTALELSSKIVEYNWQGAIMQVEQKSLRCSPCGFNFVTPDLWYENDLNFDKAEQYLEHILDGGCP